MSRATVICDEGGAITGVAVRIVVSDDTEAGIRALAVAALMEHGDADGDRLTEAAARDVLADMSHCRTDSFRWVPRDLYGDGRRVRCIEDADAASRGSFIGRYWSRL